MPCKVAGSRKHGSGFDPDLTRLGQAMAERQSWLRITELGGGG